MPLSKKVLLEALSGWDQNTHQLQLDQLWQSHLQELTNFVDAHGQMPRYKNYSSELEHRLGVWLHNQHQRRSQGSLVAWRLEALNAVAPGWRSRR
ncbi:helicase associated domain-containing protein (plasmid) [Glutamicibacter sp. FR1]|uniref:helicase associated domain-containing protein n=1 Tax=Glutamicibacter sp. FR1 TaxID=3393744 RepID=UPI0039AFA2BE